MVSPIAIIMALIFAYMLAFTTIKKDSIIVIAALFLLGAYLAGGL